LMAMARKVTYTVNGVKRSADIEDNELLLDVLHEKMGVKSVKAACWRGECGLCTALVDGRPVKTCLILGVDVDGSEIVTAEGLAGEELLSPLQKAFVEHGALQCGFCTPAFVVTAHHLLETNPDATEEEIKEYLSGCVCRCGTYFQIVEAVKDAAKHYKKGKS
jgi:carbon-monoxide dehydrogenase small subunit